MITMEEKALGKEEKKRRREEEEETYRGI